MKPPQPSLQLSNATTTAAAAVAPSSKEQDNNNNNNELEQSFSCGGWFFSKVASVLPVVFFPIFRTQQKRPSSALILYEHDDDDDKNEDAVVVVATTATNDECRFFQFQSSSSSSTTTCTTLSSSSTSWSEGIRSLSRSSSWWSFANSSSFGNGTSNDVTPEINSHHHSLSSFSSISSSSSSFLEYAPSEWALSDDIATLASDLTIIRPIWIVTTAALPWMTGTAVNPLLRAAYLAHYQTHTLRSPSSQVHLVIPWLESAQDRIELYGSEWKDKTPKDQETYIRNWLAQASVVEYECHNNNHDYHSTIEIHFYPARFHKSLGSIFAMGDVCEHLKLSSSHNDENHDAICILEEPEHLNYYRASRRSHWRHIFRHVVGVIHTNYEVYAVQNSSLAAPLVGAVSAWMVRAYCDKVIQLSKTLPGYAPEKEVVQNVHGVRTPFLQRRYRRGQKIYFLGKLLWAKGLDALLHLERVYRWRTGHFFPIDVYGTGPDAEEMRQAFANTATTTTYTSSTSSKSANHHCQTPRRRNSSSSSSSSTWTTTISMCTPHPLHWRTTNNNKDGDHAVTGALSFFHNKQEQSDEPIPVQFLGPVDHLHLDTDHDDNDNRHQHCTTHDDSVTAKEQYKIFVNPSISEVLCTVTAEAIAMGKFAIIPDHPSNTFFRQCPNCLMYTTDDEFVDQLQYAISNSPIPLDDNTRRILSWEAATERFIQAAAISHRQAARLERLRVRDEKYAEWHCKLGEGRTGDVLRKVLGGGPVAEQSKYELQKQQQQQRFQQEKQSPPDVDDDYDEGSLSPLSLSSRSQNDGVVQKQ